MKSGLNYFDVVVSVRKKGDSKSLTKYQIHTVGSAHPEGQSKVARDIREWCQLASRGKSKYTYRLDQIGRAGTLDGMVSRLTELGLIDTTSMTIRL